MKHFHVVHAACVAPVIDALRSAGAPIDRMLERSGLHCFYSDDPNGFLPAKCVHDFFEEVARRETGPHLPYEILSQYSLANMGGFGDEVRSLPDLRSGFLLASQPEARQLSYETVALETHGKRSTLSDMMAIPPQLARSWFEHMTIHLIVDTCAAADGPDFAPLEIHVTDDKLDDLEEIVSAKTVVRRHASKIAVVFPTEILANSVGQDDPAVKDIYPAPRLDQKVASTIEAILDTSTSAFTPNLNRMAELSGISPRTLQRRLREEGVSFHEAIDQWRCNRALGLISRPGVRIKEIAENLRYSDTAHFIRAFKRWTSVTPGEYRDG